MSQKRTVKPFVEHLKVRAPIVHKNLTIVPITAGQKSKLEYTLASEAMKDGTLEVTESSAAGSVNELRVRNSRDTFVLIVDGEELIGAKQNRILNTSVLVPPKAKITVPVSCVEQGRWRLMTETFVSGGYAHSSLRARKSAAVTNNLRMHRVAQADQSDVWAAVDECAAALAAPSPTGAMKDVFDQQEHRSYSYKKSLKYVRGSRGMIVAINGRFTVLDLFDNPKTLEAMWERLISSYTIDALMSGHDCDESFDKTTAGKLLTDMGEMQCEVFPSVGHGDEWRFESDSVVGQALVADDTCVHLSAFPKAICDSRQDRPSRFTPPSRRYRGPRRAK